MTSFSDVILILFFFFFLRQERYIERYHLLIKESINHE